MIYKLLMKIASLFIILFFLILSTTSCSATGLVTCDGQWVYNPDDFTAEEQAWIQSAGGRWNHFVGSDVVEVSPGKRDACVIQKGPTTNPEAIGQDYHHTEVISIDLDHLRRINQLTQVEFEAVVMHEIGHSLGYKHILTGPALMAPYAAHDFTELDRIACINRGMCPAKHN